MAQSGVVIYTQEYPTPNDPTDGVFTQQLARALCASRPVTVICPMPWWPDIALLKRVSNWVPSTNVPYRVEEWGLDVRYPKVPLVPYFTRVPQPVIQALRALPILRRLKAAGRAAVLNAHAIYPDGVSAALACKWLGIPLVLTAIGSDINANLGKPLHLRQIKWAMSQAKAVVGVSHDLVAKMQAFGLSVPVSRIPNGVDRTRFFPTEAGERERTLLFVGRLHPVKGLTYLLSALAQLKRAGKLDFRTVLVGEGGEEGRLREQCTAADLQGEVQFAGAQAHAKIGEWMRRASVFCLPSRNEGMPNVVIEAQACGLPIVASRVGGLGELVGAHTGILVPRAEPSALAAALEEAFTRNWDRRAICEHVAWADWNRSAEEYLRLYAQAEAA
jgi:glycosyltransferase involved in cell wall biosynthesis